MSRLVIRDFTQKIAEADITDLFSKLCPVVEVHLADSVHYNPKGLVKRFAIVRLDSTDPEVVLKCIRAFNGSLWKGSKIKVEKAKAEYFMDRIDRERKDAVIVAEEERLAALRYNEEIDKPPTQMSSDLTYLKIKKDRLSRPVKVGGRCMCYMRYTHYTHYAHYTH